MGRGGGGWRWRALERGLARGRVGAGLSIGGWWNMLVVG